MQLQTPLDPSKNSAAARISTATHALARTANTSMHAKNAGSRLTKHRAVLVANKKKKIFAFTSSHSRMLPFH